jgi:hypothetical protein
MSSRRVLPVATLVLVAFVLVGQVRQLLADPTIWPPDDFVEYWAAAKLTLAGKNPYDPNLLLPLEQSAGRQTEEAVMLWNPPWSLALVLPLGLLPPREAQLLWLAVNFLAIGYCGDRLWLLFGGSRDRRWVGWLVVLIALPTAFALQSGQIGPLLLLGAVLFLECLRQRREWLAGAATVLLAVKPHLAYLVWLAILFDAIGRGRWRILVGGAVAGLICTVIALASNHQVLQQYSDALGNRPPAQWVSPTIGTVLRMAVGEEIFRLQFIPMMLGLLWFVWHRWYIRSYRSSNGPIRDWCEELPLLLLVSFVTAPYGAWPFDMVLLLPATMWLILNAFSTPPSTLSPQSPFEGRKDWGARQHVGKPVAKGQLIIAGLVAINLGCLILNLLHITSFWFLWVSPAVLGLYVLSQRWQSRISCFKSESVSTADQALVPA